MNNTRTRVFLLFFLFLILAGVYVGVTNFNGNTKAKLLGGTIKIDLPAGKKLVTVTWKDNDVWYLTRKMKQDESAETYEFTEHSNFGMMEGKVILTEHK